jgi:hypothetical protein
MAGDDLTVIGNQHGIVEAKLFDRRRDLLDLTLAMAPRVTRVRFRRSDRNMLDCWIELSHAGHQKLQEPNDPSNCARFATSRRR